MTAVTFETAALADSIKKANTIAPSRGKEFDMYKGFVLDVFPEHGRVLLRATNGEVFYSEYLSPLKIEGPELTWRIPSAVTNGIVSNLPIGSGKTVKFENEAGYLRITSGRMRARVPLIPNDYFPDWDDFEDEDMPVVEGFGARLDQVAWACHRGNTPPINGVYIDREKMVGTDRAKVAIVPIAFDPGEGEYVVVPVGILAPVVRGMEEIKVNVQGNFLCIAPNEDTHIKCVLFGEDYPKVANVMAQVQEEAIILDRDLVVETMTRMRAIGTGDRQMPLKVVIGEEQIAFHMRDEQSVEEIEDSIYLSGQADHPPVTYLFGPDIFMDAVGKSPNKMMTFNYNLTEQKKLVKFEGGSGYEVAVRPRVAMEPKEPDAG